MEKLVLTSQSKEMVMDHQQSSHLVKYEAGIILEILAAINQNDQEKLDWFNRFGDSLRHIYMNVHAYRKNMEFGFDEFTFGEYGWFKRPDFLDKEDIILGNAAKYSEHSIIQLGRGKNNIWTYGLNYSFGLAGGGYGLTVYGKQFENRKPALNCGLLELKNMMTAKIGNTDTSNYKQAVIKQTLDAIVQLEVSEVQLSLF